MRPGTDQRYVLLSVSECVGLARSEVFAKMFSKIAFPIVLYRAKAFLHKLTEEIVLFPHPPTSIMVPKVCVCFKVFHLYSKLNKMFFIRKIKC